MTKNPLVNAVAALVYIVVVASVMFYGGKMAGPDVSIIGPLVVMSLFTFSAAAMAFIFFYNPFQMYFDGKKKVAIELSFRSVGYFGVITFILLILFFSGLLS